MDHVTSPQERLACATMHADLLRSLLMHPVVKYTPDGQPDRSKIPDSVYYVIDFEVRTYRDYILPLLPPDAEKHSHDLAVFQAADGNNDMLADDLFPRMSVGGFEEKWTDSISRAMLISMIITEPSMMTKFGTPFDLGPEVKAAARAFLSD
ncbi:hypothetical protein EDD37DRAFT_567345 [Exophiala viscosa]|uniref:uncharacterized protein n=1 Tax=Exophiala viscosa TaxID=2486360 RepID=UPI002196008C|nr:hypothetical protein EDD37DRAFT_567345 [Exophiala viscosa]